MINGWGGGNTNGQAQPGRELRGRCASLACMYVEIYVCFTVTLRVAGWRWRHICYKENMKTKFCIIVTSACDISTRHCPLSNRGNILSGGSQVMLWKCSRQPATALATGGVMAEISKNRAAKVPVRVVTNICIYRLLLSLILLLVLLLLMYCYFFAVVDVMSCA